MTEDQTNIVKAIVDPVEDVQRHIRRIYTILAAVVLAVLMGGAAFALLTNAASAERTGSVADKAESNEKKNERQDDRINRTNADKDLIARVVAGPQGVKGLRGLTGPLGRTGRKGTTGIPGAEGSAGIQGETGLSATGAVGPQGPVGEPGAPCAPSNPLCVGPQGEPGKDSTVPGPPGKDGDDGVSPPAPTQLSCNGTAVEGPPGQFTFTNLNCTPTSP